MKKLAIFVLITFMGLYYSVNAQIQCPPGFMGPDTLVINLCGNTCPLEIVWCCNPTVGQTPPPEIHIHSFRFLMDPTLIQSNCICLSWIGQQYPDPGQPMIPLAKVLTAIFASQRLCYDSYPYIPPCEPPGTIRKVKVSVGSCYKWENTLDYIGYRTCFPILEKAYCHQDYTICLRLIDGEFVIDTIEYGGAEPQFECIEGCHPLCDFISY